MQSHVCPWWLGFWLAGAPRRLLHNPKAIVSPFISDGMTILEPGPGMGFFTLEMARAAGHRGRVIAVDIQQKMLDGLGRRARRAGLIDRIDLRLAGDAGMGIDDLLGMVDFVLAFAVVHEVPDPALFFAEALAALKKGGSMLFSEPRSQVTIEEFERSLGLARSAGLAVKVRPEIRSNRSAVLEKR